MRHLFTLLLACSALLATAVQARPLDRVEAVVLTSPAGGVRLSGLIRLPTGNGPFAAAVLLPERGTDERNPLSPDNLLLTSLADHLVSQGMIVLRLHARGNGGSEGQATTTTLAERAADALAALNFLRTRPQVDVTRLGLIGHGEGANVALLAAAQPQAPTFVVAVAAAGLPGHELLANQPVMYGKMLGRDTLEAHQQHAYRLAEATAQTEAAKLRAQGSNAAQVQTYLDQRHLRLKAQQRRDQDARLKHQRAMLEIVRQTPDNAQAQAILSNMLRQRYPAIAAQDVQASVQAFTTPAYRSYLAFDPLPTLPQVQCPVLLLQGDDDPEVNATANLSLLKKGLKGNPHVTERRQPGLNHALQITKETAGFEAPLSPDVLTEIYGWLQAQR
jgi:pimeloyl-ACP methyl ester carboxylesterase